MEDVEGPLLESLDVGEDWKLTLDFLVKKAKNDWLKATKKKNTSRKKARDDEDSNRLIIAACGAKGLGKSTFLRVLRKMLHVAALEVDLPVRVYYIDTDLGQPEKGVPGIITVQEGENIKEALFLGDDSPSRHPTSYMDACRELSRRFFHSSPQPQHQVVLLNTHGWNTGLGATMVETIVKTMQTSHVVHITHPSRPDSLSFGDCPQVERVFPVTGSVAGASYSPFEARFVRLTRYFKAKSLTQLELQTPYRVDASKVELVPSIDPSEENELESADAQSRVDSFNGCMVGICTRDDESSNFFNFLGMGIVRAVDTKEGVLYVMTPLSLEQVSRATCLVLGTQPLPLARWSEGCSEGVQSAAEKPFFALEQRTVNMDLSLQARRKHLKRRRLLR